MVTIQQGLREEGIRVAMAKLCRWFEMPRRTVYYRPTKSPPTVKPELAEPIKALVEQKPSLSYRTPTLWLARAQARDRQPSSHRSTSLGGQAAGRALGIGSVPDLGRQRWLDKSEQKFIASTQPSARTG